MRQQTKPQDLLNKWEAEIEENGVIADESLLLSSLSTETNPVILSKLLSFAAISRQNKHSSSDTLAKLWMEKALRLDPNNEKAKAFMFEADWLNMKDLLDSLSFPLIRETDNRTTKKKIAEEYIEICRSFLTESEDQLEDLRLKAERSNHINNQGIQNKYRILYDLYEKTVKTVVNLLKASEEYDESITGVFHTSTYYEDLKFQLSQIEIIAGEWKSLFNHHDENLTEQPKALDQLHEMIGLEMVKERINAFYRFLKYQKQRKEIGFQTKDEMSLNMILTGNPGTGKTTLARLLAKIYHELGVLPREEVIEVDRAQLVGAFVGQTEENVRTIVEKAVGGVLFIDEAYSLKREGQSGNDYGQTAIDTLVSLMTGKEYGGKFAVILAGYPEEMRSFIDANPGLRSRFPQSNFIHLPDYSNEELLQIAVKIAADNDYLLTEEAKVEFLHRLDRERVDDSFGNARTVRNLVLEAIFKKGGQESSTIDNILHYTLINQEDFRIESDGKSEQKPGDALQQLIGLDEIKSEMNTLISLVKMQQFRRMKGLPVVPVQLHAVFTGNPGTGKTTVAKIYAELLKECGVLKRGHLIISSRADLVAGYVGQTAPKTKKKIRSALGGVLFIDEAYSLFSSTTNDFGREAIDTIVDEMTKHNENLVVILAGYPQEMDQLLQSNPGLRSRFKKFFHFVDYTKEQLLEIMETYAIQYQYTINAASKKILLDSINNKTVNGNGRFATNLVDEMIQAQALRIMALDLTEQELMEKAMILEAADALMALTKMTMITDTEGEGNG